MLKMLTAVNVTNVNPDTGISRIVNPANVIVTLLLVMPKPENVILVPNPHPDFIVKFAWTGITEIRD